VSRYRKEAAALRRNEPGTVSGSSKAPAPVAPRLVGARAGLKPGATASKSAAQAQKRARNTQQEANHP
jgi:hypothetical protein